MRPKLKYSFDNKHVREKVHKGSLALEGKSQITEKQEKTTTVHQRAKQPATSEYQNRSQITDHRSQVKINAEH